MKKYLILAILSGLSAFAAQAYAEDYCLAARRVEPYSSRVTYTAECNGRKIKSATGWFGSYEDGFRRIEDKLHENGYTLLESFSNKTIVVFSKEKKIERPRCLVEARYLGKCYYHIECLDDAATVKLPFSKSALDSYLSKYSLAKLQSMRSIESFRVAGQCKGLDRYFLVK